MNTPAKVQTAPTPATLNDVLIRGDLSKLTEPQRTEYYLNVCRSLGLNPLTQPFAYLTLSGKLVLYAKRDAADQLRKLNGISIEIVSQQTVNDLLTVHARAKDRDGRTDEDFGVVPLKGGGEFAANAIMKAVTKAKRKVTLSISGLGFLDETEVDTEPGEPVATMLSPDVPHGFTPGYSADGTVDWRAWGSELLTHIRRDGEHVAWLTQNKAYLEKMKAAVPKMHANLMAAIDENDGETEL